MSSEPHPDPPPRTRTAEVIDAGRKAATTVANFTPQQAVVFLCVVLMGFVCASLVFQQYADREERKATARERSEAAATTIRENNAQAELTRQHCAGEAASLRQYFADQTERRMRFEAEERAKDRIVLDQLSTEKVKGREAIAALVASFEELRKLLAKKFDVPNG